MLSLLTIPVIFSCSTVLDIASVDTTMPQGIARQFTVTLIAESREEAERRDEEIRQHEATNAQRARELRERAADTAKESHDEKIPARNAHDFFRSF